jgi:flagellar hook assembly protein FlgD
VLKQNYPNPFNPSTTIKYALPMNSDVTLKIYDIMGREIKSFIIPGQQAGYQNIVWDSKNNLGYTVASGIYIYRFSAKSLKDNRTFSKSCKMILLK